MNKAEKILNIFNTETTERLYEIAEASFQVISKQMMEEIRKKNGDKKL